MSSSRPYRIKVRESIQETVVADDSVTSKLDLVPILPPEGMADISRTILKEHGFEEDGGGAMSRERDGIKVTIDPTSGAVEARAEGSTDIDISDEEDAGGWCPCSARNKDRVIEAMRKRLRKQADGIAASLQELVTGKLSRSLADLGCEMEQIANQITARSLKRKAQEIGTIKRIHHNDQTGEIAIVVEV